MVNRKRFAAGVKIRDQATWFERKPSLAVKIEGLLDDVMGATAFGFRCVWVNRTNAPEEYPEFAPVKVVRELSALATLEV